MEDICIYYEPFKNDSLQRQVETLIRTIKFSGCFEIEFLLDSTHKLHFLEINLRFSASNYSINVGGFNLPYEWAKATLAHRIGVDTDSLRKDKFFIMNEKLDIQSVKEVGYFRWLKELLSADGYYLYNRHDKKPLHFWVLQQIKKHLHIK